MLGFLLFLSSLLCLFFLFLTVVNIRFLKRHAIEPRPVSFPKVSVIVPARNEERHIASCLDALLAQDYPNLEILVYNDQSEDGTAAILEGYAAANSSIRVITGTELGKGWYGKQNACHRAAAEATGEILIFTDADARLEPRCVSWAVASLEKHGVDFISGYLRQIIKRLGEALVVPCMFLMTTILLPLAFVPKNTSATFSFAIGQLLVVRRRAYEAIGGYESFKNSVVEDMAMARAVKTAGFKTIFLDAKAYASCRMYRGYGSAVKGYSKVVYGAINGNPLFLLGLVALFALAVFLPLGVLVQGVLAGHIPFGAGFASAVFLLTWTAVIADRGLGISQALLYPLVFLNMVMVSLISAFGTGVGKGIRWKGRLVRIEKAAADKKLGPYFYSYVDGFLTQVLRIFLSLILSVYDTLAFRTRVDGREQLKALNGKGFFAISNHSLYMDPALVTRALLPRGVYYSAMKETFQRPLLGPFIRLLGAFPVSNDMPMETLRRMCGDIIASGRCVHFFPEGELAHLNKRLQPFQLGVFYLSLMLDVPIVPVVIVTKPRPALSFDLNKFFCRADVSITAPISPRRFLSQERNLKQAAVLMAAEAQERIQAVLNASDDDSFSGVFGSRTEEDPEELGKQEDGFGHRESLETGTIPTLT